MDFSHSFLVDIGAVWLHKKASNIYYRCQFVCKEFNAQGTNEIPDIFGLRPNNNVLIEVKVSRSDFLHDFKKDGRNDEKLQLGNYRFYLVPKNLVKPDEIPNKWGLLEFDGKDIEMAKKPEKVEGCDYAASAIYYSILRRTNKYQVFDFKKKTEKDNNKNIQKELF